MTILQFRQLHKIEQEDEVDSNGVFLVTYYDDNVLCDVYKLYKFFVKFSYNLKRIAEPVISAMTGTDDVQFYEHKIFPFSGS